MLYFWGVGLHGPTRVNCLNWCEKIESLDFELDRGESLHVLKFNYLTTLEYLARPGLPFTYPPFVNTH